MHTRPQVIDANDAPEGYYAVPKSSIKTDENKCRHCDWRPTCQRPETDTLRAGQNCRGYAVIAFTDGKTYQRRDGVGVVFKLRPA